MGDKGKTKKQLLQEIQRLRQEIDRLKASHHRDLFPAGPAANGE